MKKVLELVDLEKTFTLKILHHKTIAALRQINLTVQEGEVLGLVGKSGSGKSTLMKCIYRTYLPTAGAMYYHSPTLGSVDLVTAPDQVVLQLRKAEITYCAQFLSVIPRVSALEVVASGLFGRSEKKDTPLALARTYLEQIELPAELWDAYPSTFSGGEQQRVNVARAIIARPRLLLIDEPTASLDAKTKDVVIDLLLELKNQGSTIVVISHDAHTLDRLCDRQVRLEHGAIVEPVTLHTNE